MKSKTDFFAGICTIAISVLGAWGITTTTSMVSTTDPIGPVNFSIALLWVLFFLGVFQCIVGFYDSEKKDYWPPKYILKKVVFIIIWFCLYLLGIMILDSFFESLNILFLQDNIAFCVSSTIFLMYAFYLSGRSNPIEIILISCALPLLIVLVFSKIFLVTLP